MKAKLKIMSISRHLDEYLANNQLEEKAEVVPESECHVFEKDVVREREQLENVRKRVEKQLK